MPGAPWTSSSETQSQTREVNSFGALKPANSPSKAVSCTSVSWQPTGTVVVDPLAVLHEIAIGGLP